MDKSVIVSRKHPAEKETLAVRMRQNMTAAERMLWERLRRNQVGGLHFRRQQVIDGFIADFYCHTAKLVIEADGSVHEVQAEYDRERDRIIATHQLTILRFTNHQILTDIETVMAKIQATIHASGSYPPLKEGPGGRSLTPLWRRGRGRSPDGGGGLPMCYNAPCLLSPNRFFSRFAPSCSTWTARW